MTEESFGALFAPLLCDLCSSDTETLAAARTCGVGASLQLSARAVPSAQTASSPPPASPGEL